MYVLLVLVKRTLLPGASALGVLYTQSLAVSAVYVYKGDPFQLGPLPVGAVTFKADSDGIPKRTEGERAFVACGYLH